MECLIVACTLSNREQDIIYNVTAIAMDSTLAPKMQSQLVRLFLFLLDITNVGCRHVAVAVPHLMFESFLNASCVMTSAETK